MWHDLGLRRTHCPSAELANRRLRLYARLLGKHIRDLLGRFRRGDLVRSYKSHPQLFDRDGTMFG